MPRMPSTRSVKPGPAMTSQRPALRINLLRLGCSRGRGSIGDVRTRFPRLQIHRFDPHLLRSRHDVQFLQIFTFLSQPTIPSSPSRAEHRLPQAFFFFYCLHLFLGVKADDFGAARHHEPAHINLVCHLLDTSAVNKTLRELFG